MLYLAAPEEAKEIYGVFRTYPHIFPHLRYDYLCRMIAKRQCVWQDGVVITFQRYLRKVRLGDVVVPKGTIVVHQIAMSFQAPLGAPGRIFREFHDHYVAPGAGLVLTVRQDNRVARWFYEREGLCPLGTIEWSLHGRPLPGIVYGSPSLAIPK